ncbi:MAG TPA: GAF domain-containing protein [Acidimicrobiales bacterium]|nr:GAF domain-containing protein [Acidimicrobiales bacterium]
MTEAVNQDQELEPVEEHPVGRRHMPARLAALIFVAITAAWLFGVELLAHFLAEPRHHSAAYSAAGWLLVAVTGGALAVVLFRRLENERRSRSSLGAMDDILRSIQVVTEPSLALLSLNKLLDELLARVITVLGVNVATIFLLSQDSQRLEVKACAGYDELSPLGPDVRIGEGVAGQVAATAEPVIAESMSTTYAGHVPGISSVMAAPLTVEGGVMGVLELGSRSKRGFSEHDLRLLRMVADRVAAAVERARLDESQRRAHLAAERAREQLALLSQAGEVLAVALDDYQPALTSLGKVVVPAFADWFAVDVADTDDLQLRRAVSVTVQHGQGERLDRIRWSDPEWNRLIEMVRTQGETELMFEGPFDRGGRHHPILGQLGFQCLMLVPLRVHGDSFGVLAFAIGAGRRGYRPSDMATAEAVSQRVGIAVERVLLYREAQQAERSAIEHAAQLRRMMEASLAVNGPPSENEVLRVLAEQARWVMQAERAVVAAAGPDGELLLAVTPAPARAPSNLQYTGIEELLRSGNRAIRGGAADAARSGLRMPNDHWLAAPLNDSAGGYLGSIVLVGGPEDGFSAEDESILVSMAQMGSVAVENARLYQAVQANGQRLSTLMESAPLAIIELDLEGNSRWWNRAARNLFGWPEPGQKGLRPPPLDYEVAERLSQLWYRAVRGQETLGVEVEVHRASDKPELHLSISTAPMRADDGSVTGIMALVEDITERKRLQDQFHQAERLDAMGRLAGGVAHDFNNLLTVILGYTDVLLRRLDDADPQRNELEAIRRAGKRAAVLTAQLLAVGRREMVNPEVLEPAKVVASMEPMLRSVMGGDVELRLDLPHNAGQVLVDPSQMERAILNLAINARDAMPDGGSLTVSVSRERVRDDLLPIGAIKPGTYVAVAVTDTGHGMTPEILEHCFEPFFTTKEKSKGTGLGLAAVHGIVTQAGGQVTAHSVPGAGTTFRFLFPAVNTEASERVEEEGSDDFQATGTVLVVEDEDELRGLVCGELEWRGYRVLEAADGEAGLSVAQKHRSEIDLLVTDVVMPRMSGPELAKQLPEIPVLFISGYSGDEKLANGRLPAGADLLPKPFPPAELARRVADALERAGQGSKR